MSDYIEIILNSTYPRSHDVGCAAVKIRRTDKGKLDEFLINNAFCLKVNSDCYKTAIYNEGDYNNDKMMPVKTFTIPRHTIAYIVE